MCPSLCPLCGAVESYALLVAGKHYHRCRSCELVWLDGADHLGPSAEKAVYDGHDNQVDDPRYRHFLMRAFGEVLSRVPPPASGLDFGCGPGPALIAMGREAGYQMAGYDKFYADLPDLLTRQYDFITSTEVIEHIADPRAALDVLWGCLKPGGILLAGDLVADIVDPLSDTVTALRTARGGRLFARHVQRFATAGDAIAKVAGNESFRTGNLLTA